MRHIALAFAIFSETLILAGCKTADASAAALKADQADAPAKLKCSDGETFFRVESAVGGIGILKSQVSPVGMSCDKNGNNWRCKGTSEDTGDIAATVTSTKATVTGPGGETLVKLACKLEGAKINCTDSENQLVVEALTGDMGRLYSPAGGDWIRMRCDGSGAGATPWTCDAAASVIGPLQARVKSASGGRKVDLLNQVGTGGWTVAQTLDCQ